MTHAEAVRRAVSRAQADWISARANPWYLVEKGVVMTLDEKPGEGVPAIRPLPALDYLHAITELWLASQKGLLGKSRQMLISWIFAWLTLWDAIFHDGRHNIIQGKRLEDVDAQNPHHILGRARFIRQHLPPIFQPKVKAENTTSETYANGSSIEAIPEGADIVRGKVPSTMFMDEIAFQETSESNWNAAVPSAAKLWGVSTPNGHEFMYRQADEGRPWDEWREWPSVMRGLHGYVNSKGIQLAFLHYTADEGRCTPEWQRKAYEGYTNSRDALRELEGDFSLAAGLPVYGNEFSRATHVIDRYVPDPLSPIYRGWDFGYNGQSVAFFQQSANGQLVWFDQVILKAVALPRVIQEVRRRTLNWLGTGTVPVAGSDGLLTKREPQLMDYGDPSAESHNTKGETDAATLSQYGITLISRPTTGRKRAIVDGLRRLLLPRADGKPGLVVARNTSEMDHVIAGFSGGYHYDKPKEGKAEKEVPAKDGLYDHIFDAAQYLVDNISPIRFGGYEQEPDPEWWKIDDPGIGTPEYA